MAEQMSQAFDGAGADLSVSADAMRWSPVRTFRDHRSVDCSTGWRELLTPQARRVVARVVAPFARVAGDVADDARRIGNAWRRRPVAG
jgi:hypothetical protein